MDTPYFKSDWSSAHLEWLYSLTESLDPGASAKLKSLLREFEFYKSEAAQMDQELLNLSETDKYKPYVKALTKFKGVGLITSMVFLTELGDMSRFPNRKAVGSYLGLVPRSFETGEAGERKGPISKMGSRRLRKVLNQAAWAAVTWDAEWNSWFNERVQGKKKEKRRFIVAVMRKLAIMMWHRALEVSLEINR